MVERWCLAQTRPWPSVRPSATTELDISLVIAFSKSIIARCARPADTSGVKTAAKDCMSPASPSITKISGPSVSPM